MNHTQETVKILPLKEAMLLIVLEKKGHIHKSSFLALNGYLLCEGSNLLHPCSLFCELNCTVKKSTTAIQRVPSRLIIICGQNST